jgi:cytoskeleton protein RodZ
MFEIGNTLREARLRRGLDILDCEAETKIRAKYLRAMEEEQFDLMPSPTYVRGFLRTYAEFLGLDGQLVLDEYESRFGGLDAPFDPAPRPSRASRAPGGPDGRGPRGRGGRREPTRRRRRTEVQLLWLAIGGVMTVALLIWLGVGEDETPPALPTQTAPASVTTAPTRSAPDTEPEEALVNVRKTEIALEGVGVNGSWVRIYGNDADGELTRVVYETTLVPGTSKTFKVDRRLKLRAANPAELEVTVDGKARELEGGTGNWIISRTKVTPVD